MSQEETRGKVITFYSYKGGTGRSMLLANIAWLLASNDKKVMVIDWDLEAPGLHRYFKPFLVDSDLTATDGLIDWVWLLTTRVMSEEALDKRTLEHNSHFFDADEAEDFIVPLDWKFPGRGGIDFIGAGRQGSTYSERVNTFDWKYFYEIGGGAFLDRVKQRLVSEYDYVLIDSRTGVSDTSGICTAQLPDILVACLTLNRQSIEGVAAVLSSARAWQENSIQKASRESRRAPAKIYPVATRIENSEKERLDFAREKARTVFRTFLKDSVSEQRAYWDDMEVTYRPFYAYEEILAAFGDQAGAAGSANTLLSEVERIGRRIVGDKHLVMPQMLEADRQATLMKYSFDPQSQLKPSTHAANEGEATDLDFQRSIFAKETQWRLAGFPYSRLLSGRELQLIIPQESAKFGRQMAFFYYNSTLVPEFRDRTFVTFTLLWSGFLLYCLSIPARSLLSPFMTFNQFVGFFQYANFVALMFLIVICFRMLFLYRWSRKPYGTSLTQVIRLCLSGPLAPDIRDYVPE